MKLRTVVALGCLALAVSCALMSDEASAAAVGGARYLGLTSDFSNLDFSVSADGTRILEFNTNYLIPSIGHLCGGGTNLHNNDTPAESLPTTNNGFSNTAVTGQETVSYTGAFGESGFASG